MKALFQYHRWALFEAAMIHFERNRKEWIEKVIN
jgi:hypothetical protein